MLHQYGFGKPKETVKLEGEGRAPTQAVFLRPIEDPLARPEAPQRRMPILPPAAMPEEVPFDMSELGEEPDKA